MKLLEQRNKNSKDEQVREHIDYGVNHVYEIKKDNVWVSHLDLGYESVTKFISKFFSKFDADNIIDTYYEKWQNDPSNKYFGKSKVEIKSDWDKFRDYKAGKGTHMHYQFESYFNEEDFELIPEINEFKKWLVDYKVTAFRTEMTVYSDHWGIVGNIDLIYIDDDGCYNICDFKRMDDVKKPYKFQSMESPFDDYIECEETKHSMQLSIYKDILEREYGMKIKGLYNLYIINDKPYNYQERDYINLQKLGVLK